MSKQSMDIPDKHGDIILGMAVRYIDGGGAVPIKQSADKEDIVLEIAFRYMVEGKLKLFRYVSISRALNPSEQKQFDGYLLDAERLFAKQKETDHLPETDEEDKRANETVTNLSANISSMDKIVGALAKRIEIADKKTETPIRVPDGE